MRALLLTLLVLSRALAAYFAFLAVYSLALFTNWLAHGFFSAVAAFPIIVTGTFAWVLWHWDARPHWWHLPHHQGSPPHGCRPQQDFNRQRLS